MRVIPLMVGLLACVGFLAGCSEAKEQLGLTRQAPDEFAVLKRAPLALPPNYKLRPPQPGAPRPQESAPAQQAQQALFGQENAAQTETPAGVSPGEETLLNMAGAPKADPGVRQKLDAEGAEQIESQKPVAQKLLGIGGEEDPARVVDAPAEAARIKKNMDEGKSLDTGATPTVDQ